MADPVDTQTPSLPLMSPSVSGLVPTGTPSTPSTSGTTQDWATHTQMVSIMYVRNQIFNTNVSSTISSPAVSYNYVDAQATVTTNDQIWEDATFSGEAWIPQRMNLVSNAPSGGFGQSGTFYTSLQGYIRKAATTDAAGNFLDPTGTCTKVANFKIDKQPGTYNALFDTSATVNSKLAQIIERLVDQCPTFNPGLVDL